jgi:hypothetical protein
MVVGWLDCLSEGDCGEQSLATDLVQAHRMPTFGLPKIRKEHPHAVWNNHHSARPTLKLTCRPAKAKSKDPDRIVVRDLF